MPTTERTATTSKSLRVALRRAGRKARGTAGEWRRSAQAGEDPDVLVESPVFLLSSTRSGSTLLRMVLDSHPNICAPHEMHLGSLKVSLPAKSTKPAMRDLGLDAERLELMLWDRVMLRELVRSGKSVIVDKTPKNTKEWRRISAFWPSARYIFLLRHPLRIAESMIGARADVDVQTHYAAVNEFADFLHEARTSLPGLTIRYEDFAADPATGAGELCAFLDVPFVPAMLDYGGKGKRPIRRGLGDWSPAIKSGKIQPPAPAPTEAEIPPELVPACRLLGYL
jgi:hypothetical protein